MNARVRSPGSSAAETASAAAAPQFAVGRLQPAERDVERQLLVVELDPERRDQLAEQPAPGALARDRLLGEDLLLGSPTAGAGGSGARCAGGGGRSRAPSARAARRRDRRRARPTRARRTAASVSISVARSCTSCSSAPRSGSAVSVENRSDRVRAGAPDELVDLLELVHRGARPIGVELGDLAGVAGGERRSRGRWPPRAAARRRRASSPSTSGPRSHSVSSSSGSARRSAAVVMDTELTFSLAGTSQRRAGR